MKPYQTVKWIVGLVVVFWGAGQIANANPSELSLVDRLDALERQVAALTAVQQERAVPYFGPPEIKANRLQYLRGKDGKHQASESFLASEPGYAMVSTGGKGGGAAVVSVLTPDGKIAQGRRARAAGYSSALVVVGRGERYRATYTGASGGASLRFIPLRVSDRPIGVNVESTPVAGCPSSPHRTDSVSAR